MPWLVRCPDYQGVPIIKISWLSSCPDYQDVLIIKVTWLSRCPDYQGALIIKVPWLSRCPDYQGYLIIKMSWLSRWPDYQGVPIIKVSWLSKCAFCQGVNVVTLNLINRYILCGSQTGLAAYAGKSFLQVAPTNDHMITGAVRQYSGCWGSCESRGIFSREVATDTVLASRPITALPSKLHDGTVIRYTTSKQEFIIYKYI